MSDELFDIKATDIATREKDVEARKLSEQSERVSRFHDIYTIPKTRAEETLPNIINSSPKLQTLLDKLWKQQSGRDAILLTVDYWKRSNPLGLFLFRDGLIFEVWIADRSGSENFSRECNQDELMSVVEFNHLPFTIEFEKFSKPETTFEVFLGRLPFRNM